LLTSSFFQANTSPGYADIHVDPAVIDQLERVTVLALKRPDAFEYGVLQKNKVTGALYGPPGTGKTLLAKGLAWKPEQRHHDRIEVEM
jgi:ATP-dependent 26S proteasome regulatory subunit